MTSNNPSDATVIGKEQCYCGYPYCKDWWLTGIGKFVQGSGFDEEEADRIIAAMTSAREQPVGDEGLRSALRLFIGAAYPVSTEINSRGYNWSEAYLDQALENARKALATTPDSKEPTHDE